VQRALATHLAEEIRRGKIPGAQADDAATAAGMVALAMGKMGARELNYSSDIDLICLFDESRFDGPAEQMEARAAFIRVTRKMTAMLSDRTAEGYVFRTDLRLRPDASVMPVCLSMDAAERYYESLGRTWERAAYIKARPCAGDLDAGVRFIESLRPFIWRRNFDFAAIQDAHDMRLRIRAHKRLGGKLPLEGYDLKLGRGGIREIEFFTQTRQLIAGGRDPDLRERATVAALGRLAAKGWIPGEVSDELAGHYRAHREVEHRLQMIADAQTHLLPGNEEGFDRLARFMGEGDTNALRTDLTERLERVAELAEAFFSPPRDARRARAFRCLARHRRAVGGLSGAALQPRTRGFRARAPRNPVPHGARGGPRAGPRAIRPLPCRLACRRAALLALRGQSAADRPDRGYLCHRAPARTASRGQCRRLRRGDRRRFLQRMAGMPRR
jgi:[glutamine synthetase] adenylyltransferase / [glutamine synthetase]-adenylyl-L-tyrosine phosphorylase